MGTYEHIELALTKVNLQHYSSRPRLTILKEKIIPAFAHHEGNRNCSTLKILVKLTLLFVLKLNGLHFNFRWFLIMAPSTWWYLEARRQRFGWTWSLSTKPSWPTRRSRKSSRRGRRRRLGIGSRTTSTLTDGPRDPRSVCQRGALSISCTGELGNSAADSR